MNIDGESTFTSMCGAIVSLLILITVFTYAGKKFGTMIDYDDSSLKTRFENGVIDDSMAFNFTEFGSNIAVGVLISKKSSDGGTWANELTRAIDIEDYVYWEAKQILINKTVREDPIYLHTPLELRPCTTEDLPRFLDGMTPSEVTDVNNLDVVK